MHILVCTFCRRLEINPDYCYYFVSIQLYRNGMCACLDARVIKRLENVLLEMGFSSSDSLESQIGMNVLRS